MALNLDQVILTDPARTKLPDSLERAHDRQIFTLKVTGLDCAAIHKD
jgi:hypothetical protein